MRLVFCGSEACLLFKKIAIRADKSLVEKIGQKSYLGKRLNFAIFLN